MTEHMTSYEKKWSELTERAKKGDRCWMMHELASLQFQTRGLTTDEVEARQAFIYEVAIKEKLR